jgi:hypothetical protein
VAAQCPLHGETFHRVAVIGGDVARGIHSYCGQAQALKSGLWSAFQCQTQSKSEGA